MISLQSSSLIYGDSSEKVYAVREVDLTVNEGEFVGILGPSGSGKSSLLYLLSGLKMPTKGSSNYRGSEYKNMSDKSRSTLRRRSFGFIFQQPFMLGYLNALENVLVAGEKGAAAKPRAIELLNMLGIGDKMHRFPHSLSGGEKQRVCVARALVNDPEIIFADEPTASLDHTNGIAVVKLLETCRGSGAVVLVTHDPQMLEDAGKIYHVGDGQLV